MDNRFKFIGCFIAFLILAGISCWATEQSLHMLLPAGWPEILVWGITIAFFVVASIGTKLVADSLINNDYIENRTGKLIGGVLLVIFFWLLMSMPTNTHTFFYNDKIGSTITKDIETTNKYLQQVIDKGTSSSLTLDEEGKALKDAVEEQRTHIVKQFNGDEPPCKRGNGKQIAEHIKIINGLLNSQIEQDPRYNSTDPTIINGYQIEINKALAHALRTHTISEQSVKSARKQIKHLNALSDSIQNHISTGSLTEEEIRQCEKEIKDGYNIIETNKTFITFDPESDDKEVYTAENAETRTKRMSSVIDVFFIDFMKGKYPGSFWYYVILSILVDVAAFIFFDIAFTKKND
ncbi:MAG: hypothetical protein HDS64_01610 [Bacteroidales bacterium]|nr:hypothetical protein [Bacteroidales bacterium]MBD5282653.1 hypothetical protein [Bacteroides sp.]